MGVRDLTSFLRRNCPEVIKEIPTRLKALTGKTLVLDGTLVTQRFHFSPSALPSRHVLSWYRLITELKANNIGAICVFDGKERNVAKYRELQRRKEGQKITLARSALEEERLQRLSSMQPIVRQMRKLPSKKRAAVSRKLRALLGEVADKEAKSLEAAMEKVVLVDVTQTQEEIHTEMRSQDTSRDVTIDTQPIAVPQLHEGIPVSMVDKRSRRQVQTVREQHLVKDQVGQPKDSLNVESVQEGVELEHQASSQEGTFIGTEVETSEEEDRVADQVATELSQVYQAYVQSLPTFAKLQVSSIISTTSPPTITPNTEQLEDGTEPDFQVTASKNQHELALKEGEAWKKLATGSDEYLEKAEDAFYDIHERSQVAAESYKRRTKLPTQRTYQDVKELLAVMGIPCLEPEAGYEAEGLASAIVLAGHADFVVSEDSDVIIYGAPLLRHVTDKNTPLIEIVAEDIPKALSITPRAFMDFALMIGTDFTLRVKNVGPVTALKLIRTHGSVEEILRSETKIKFPPDIDEYLREIESARVIFTSLPPVPQETISQQGEMDEEAVLEYLKKFGISKEMVVQDEGLRVAFEGKHFDDDPHY
ncbi:PIN domain-like protein [Serendipita vermifera]|nr:PIN domain-like protein [Serendipita vermifera]